MSEERCEFCRFGRTKVTPVEVERVDPFHLIMHRPKDGIACWRFPSIITKERDDWCGEFARLPAQAIEARRAETGTGSVHESAVAESDAHNSNRESPNP